MIKKTLHNSINDFYETSLNYSCCFLFSFYLLWKILGKNSITKVFSYFVSFQSNAGHSIIIVILLLLHVYQAAWSFIYENLENFNSIILSMHKIRVCIENISRTEVFDVITKTRTVLQIIIFWVCLVLKYTDNEREFKKNPVIFDFERCINYRLPENQTCYRMTYVQSCFINKSEH